LYTTILSDEQNEILNKKEQARAILDEFSENEYNYVIKNKEDNKDTEEFTFGKFYLIKIKS